MKLINLIRATLPAFALLATLTSAHAQLSYYGSSGTNLYTDSTGKTVSSFGWDSSNNLYYLAATSAGKFGGIYQANLATPSSSLQLAAPTSQFAGSSLAVIGNNVYANDGAINTDIYHYNSTVGGTATIMTNFANYGLYGNNGQLYFTGSPVPSSATNNNQISFSNLSLTGTMADGPTGIEQDIAYSGPLLFDSSGNLFYAPGGTSDFSNTPHTSGNGSTIFEWSAAQVAAALADPAGHGLVANNSSLWVNYQNIADYGDYAGATSMAIDNGQLLLTLTSFGGPSELVSFGMNSDTSFNGTNATLITDGSNGYTTQLGQLEVNNGNLFVADGSQILEIAIPEPSTIFLVALGLTGLVLFRARRIRLLASSTAAVTASMFFFR